MFYKVEASRPGATAWARMHHFSALSPVPGTSVQVVATDSADVNVTFAAGTLASGGAYHWYFKPSGGQEVDTDVTAPTYTVNRVGCSDRGSYRVTVSDICGNAAEASATLLKAGGQ